MASDHETLQQQITRTEAEIATLQAKLRHLRQQVGAAGTTPAPSHPPLNGIRIVDLSWAVFGPLSTQILADMGAEVIKVERIEGGDLGRQSGSFYAVNRNKQSITVNLQTPEGRDIVLKLAETAHIFVQNFRPGVIERLGLDYATVRERNPQIVYCSLSGFGESGPYRTRGGQDLILQGMSGLMSLVGWPDTPPTTAGFYASDVTGALYNAIAMLVGLWTQQTYGVGQKIELALLNCSVAIQGFPLTWYLNQLGPAPQRAAGGHWSRPPLYGAFETKDRPITFVAGFVDVWWNRLTTMPGFKTLADDPRFATMESRREHRDALDAAVAERLLSRTQAEWIELFAAQQILCGPVYSYDELLADPQFQHHGMVQEVPAADGSTMRVVASPINLQQTPTVLRSAPPQLGQHTDTILARLGYNEAEIRTLRQRGAIG
jgi:crotonobetainyl-CoA:carnitine CoA-transferase CaiB-like acyl-CoA transferase